MSFDLLTLNQFPAVAANAKSHLVTDELKGRSVLAIIFEQSGTDFDKSHIDNLKIRQDGKDYLNNITGAQLQDVNDYDGLSATDDYFGFFFGDPTARTIRGQWLGALDMSVNQAPLEITVDIGGATAPTLQAYAIVGPPKSEFGLFTPAEIMTVRALIHSIAQPSAAVSRKSYGVGLGSSFGARLRKLAAFHNNITSMQIRKNGRDKWDDIPDALNNYIQSEFARNPQAGLYVYDSVMDGNQGGAMETVDRAGKPHNIQVNLTTSANDTITMFADVHTAHAFL